MKETIMDGTTDTTAPPRTPRTPRLAELVADDVDRRATQLLLEHAELVASWTGGTADVAPQATQLSVGDLCRYAQRGEVWPPTVAGATLAGETVAACAGALCGAPLRRWTPDEIDCLPREGLDPVLIVLAAAWTRAQIVRGEDVTLTALARLASLSRQRLEQLAAEGAIAITRGRGRVATTVTAAEARRWLAATGAPGWEAP